MKDADVPNVEVDLGATDDEHIHDDFDDGHNFDDDFDVVARVYRQKKS